MMHPRTVRIIAWLLLFLIGTVVIEGYDVLSGGNITEPWFEVSRGCWG